MYISLSLVLLKFFFFFFFTFPFLLLFYFIYRKIPHSFTFGACFQSHLLTDESLLYVCVYRVSSPSSCCSHFPPFIRINAEGPEGFVMLFCLTSLSLSLLHHHHQHRVFMLPHSAFIFKLSQNEATVQKELKKNEMVKTRALFSFFVNAKKSWELMISFFNNSMLRAGERESQSSLCLDE